jgi:hypothetical protein
MPILYYENFDLLISRQLETYFASVIQSPAGETTHPQAFQLPFSQSELYNNFDPKAFGTQLFTAVFADQVDKCLQRSLDQVRQQRRGLRIRLRLTDVPELAELPWEYLYDPEAQRFLALSETTPLARYFHLPRTDVSLQVTGPLSILAVLADPSDANPRLQVNAEWQRLHKALADLQKQGKVVLEPLKKATLRQLQSRLRKTEPIHILHFIGHGYFDEAQQSGGLQMEAEDGTSQRVSAETLGVLLQDYSPLRLFFLNACEGARAGQVEPFGGVAQKLVQQGIPAVIAMQFAITDDAALTLAQGFYQALADRYAVDTALSEARKAIFFTGNAVEWGTPVLFMRSPDGRLFDGTEQAPPPTTANPTEQTPSTPGGVQINIATGEGKITGSSISIGNISVNHPSGTDSTPHE